MLAKQLQFVGLVGNFVVINAKVRSTPHRRLFHLSKFQLECEPRFSSLELCACRKINHCPFAAQEDDREIPPTLATLLNLPGNKCPHEARRQGSHMLEGRSFTSCHTSHCRVQSALRTCP